MIAQDKSPLKQNSARIDLGRLSRWLFLTLILPMSLAMVFDLILNLQPFLTILAIVVVIPLATFFVVRVVIDELNQVLTTIAPVVAGSPVTTGAPEETISPSLQEMEKV